MLCYEHLGVFCEELFLRFCFPSLEQVSATSCIILLITQVSCFIFNKYLADLLLHASRFRSFEHYVAIPIMLNHWNFQTLFCDGFQSVLLDRKWSS